MSASRIEILQDCRFYLEKFGLCNDKHIRIVRYLSVPIALVNMLCVLPQTLAIYLLMRTVYVANFDLNVISSAFAITIGLIQIELIYFTLAANRPTTLILMNKMQSIVDDRSQTSLRTFGIYKQAEEFNRTMHQKIKRLVQIVLFVTYTPATLVPMLYLVLGTPPQEEWELPPPDPIANPHSFSGYYITLLQQSSSGVNYMVLFGVVLYAEIGLCKFPEVCYDDLRGLCDELSHGNDNDATASKRTLNDAFSLHQKIIDIKNDLQTVLAGSFFYQMVVCAAFLAVALLSIEMNHESVGSDVFVNLFSLYLQIQLNYTSCSYAQTITTRSFEVHGDFYNILWYKLPCDQQKMIAKAIHQAQQPFSLQGYNFFTCNMETFLAMIRKSYNYYLILVQVNSMN